jgi:hypothetical protein
MKKESKPENSVLIKKLKKDISFNGIKINTIWVELEHINRGLIDSEAGKKVLKSKKRTSFSLNDVEKFVMLLDGEIQAPKAYEGRNSRFMLQVQCPLEGKFKDRWFIMIFKTYYDDKNVLHTITLYPMKTK